LEDDLTLLERWRAGDAQAGQALFQRHFSSIYRFFERKCPAQVDDVVQRTFLECLKSRDRFRGQSSFRTYLFSIARHELYRVLREAKRDTQLDFNLSSIEEIITSIGGRVARAQETAQLVSALSALPAEDQLLLELHYWHELDAAALAEVFEIPPTTVRTRLFRARKALRKKLALVTLDPSADALSRSLTEPECEPLD
jgi:RNA polymerase sigma-70 factor (ECF subfamily)